MPLPQFPNVFFGKATYQGRPAKIGMTVTAVVDRDGTNERHFTLTIFRAGYYGSPNGIKLKIGGGGPDLDHMARLSFYISDGPLTSATVFEAGHHHFYSDYDPHFSRLDLCQD